MFLVNYIVTFDHLQTDAHIGGNYEESNKTINCHNSYIIPIWIQFSI